MEDIGDPSNYFAAAIQVGISEPGLQLLSNLQEGVLRLCPNEILLWYIYPAESSELYNLKIEGINI